MAELLIAMGAGLFVFSFVHRDAYARYFEPRSIFFSILSRLHAFYSKVPIYRNAYQKANEAYHLLGIKKAAWRFPATLWTAGLILIALALFFGEPLFFLPGIGLMLFLPTWANNQYARYKRGLTEGLMEFVDLVAVGVTAGLPLTAALENVAESSQTIFFQEMRKIMERMQQGQPLRESMMELLKHNNSNELATFIEQLSSLYETGGMNASEIMINISRHLRELYAMRMEKEVEKIQVKMVMPLFVSIVGTLVLIGGPIVMYVGKYMSDVGGILG
ncbi:MAG: Type II/IV secretion system protein TadC, associated with Flp pilus assembly [Candidatus Carbobacillus altaicus]|uniref:Type II/IV secretion system protein TadC, associated with Flp pilus assembly n=1 Tax=Candidatus Carbonibacillus altaicus TaxID=2163959 RepID=A0A2R6Y0R0_9BACL|nr:MAG: Type II/IV secretion system protein TadC, associated with Flp pilus assembly [Candidatus Carbobacillus altaicus]